MQRKQLNLTVGDIFQRVFWIFALGLLGARLAFLLAYPDEWQSVLQIFQIWEGGLVSFGGIAVGVVVTVWFSGRAPRGGEWLAAAAKAFLIAWAVGRVGNFLSLDTSGLVSSSWNFLYGTIPIELFEALGCLVLYLLVRHIEHPVIQYVTLIGYFVVRFVVDFWRDEAVFGGLRVSQWMSAAILVLLVTLYVSMRRYRKGVS